MADDVTTDDTTTDDTDAGATAPTGGTLEEQLAAKTESEDKWKAMARQHEKAAKAAAKEADELRRKNMSEAEAAIATARDEGKAEAAKTYGGVLVSSEIRAQAAGRPIDVTALVEGIDPTKFLDDDGLPDADKISTWLNSVAPSTDTDEGAGGNGSTGTVFPDLGQGRRGGSQSDDKSLNGDPLLASLKDKLSIG